MTRSHEKWLAGGAFGAVGLLVGYALRRRSEAKGGSTVLAEARPHGGRGTYEKKKHEHRHRRGHHGDRS